MSPDPGVEHRRQPVGERHLGGTDWKAPVNELEHRLAEWRAGSCERTVSTSALPGIGRMRFADDLDCQRRTTRPRRPRLALGGSPWSTMIRCVALPNSAVGSDPTLYAAVVANSAAATATVSSTMTSECWRHSRRSSRSAHRITAGAARIGSPRARSRRGEERFRSPEPAAVWSTSRPSRRNTTRSAHDASWASWVTTTPADATLARRADQPHHAPRRSTESRAPVGSSASSRSRSPTTARAIATRWRSPPESSSGKRVGPVRRARAGRGPRAQPAGGPRRHAVELQRQRHVLRPRSARRGG